MLTQNLVVNKEFAFPKTTRFNRTFMELKVPLSPDDVRMPWFQSHLYGIERWMFVCLCSAVLCFNRTFMELKVVRHHAKDTVFIKFQSHLYGIERGSKRTFL